MRLAAGLALLLLAAPAAAAPSRADTLIARGEALTRAADPTCAAALEAAALEAEKDDEIYARAVGALGLCREVQGRWADAHQLVSRALEGAPAETTPAGRAPRWVTLRAAQRRLDERVARVLITWEDGAELYVDGRAAGGVSGRVLSVDPGRRLFEARRGGRAIAAQEVEARAGDLPAVHLRSAEASVAPSSTATSSPTTSPSPAPSQSSTPFAPALSPRGVAVTTAYVAGGVALVAGVVAGILEAQRAALASGIPRDGCPTRGESPQCVKLGLAFDQSRGARNVALVAGGVAVAAGGTAIALWITGEKRPAAAGLTWSGAW